MSNSVDPLPLPEMTFLEQLNGVCGRTGITTVAAAQQQQRKNTVKPNPNEKRMWFKAWTYIVNGSSFLKIEA
jgi:hypothetical protein